MPITKQQFSQPCIPCTQPTPLFSLASRPQPSLELLKAYLLENGITLSMSKKRVKNINFRIKVNQLAVSAPYYATDDEVLKALQKRLQWVIDNHQQLLDKQHGQKPMITDVAGNQGFMLWGELQQKQRQKTVTDDERLAIYRRELAQVMPSLFAKWQPIVGKTANEQRIKKMKTRWGSCNIAAKRVWLSVYLPQYPIECTEYMIVHELCHLHYANHSRDFWACVSDAMPNYRYWHDLLAGKAGTVENE